MKGSAEPRLFTPPSRLLTPATTAGFEVCTFADEVLGVHLLPWQRWLFKHMLELDESGAFRFRTVLVMVARQNGKTLAAQVLSLWRMFVDRAGLVIGTAQNLDVAEEVWTAAVDMAEGCRELAAEIAAVDRTNGKKALRLVTGERYKVAAASRRGGRGLSGDLVLLDELREHKTWDAWAAVTKTTMARPRPQIVALSNAGDDDSVVLNHLRSLALDELGNPDTSLGIFEWSAPDGCEKSDPVGWAAANPALGHLIQLDAVAAACATDPDWVFRTEVLCQRIDHSATSALPEWAACAAPGEGLEQGSAVAFAVDVSWDRSSAWIVAAGLTPDRRTHLEVVATRPGTDWVVPLLIELCKRWPVAAVAVQGSGAPASSLVGELEAMLPAPVLALGTAELGRACGGLYDAVAAHRVRHPAQESLDVSASRAEVRALGEAWVFDRKRSAVDAAPVMAAAMAFFAMTSAAAQPRPRRATGI